jgi:hypothetical protein
MEVLFEPPLHAEKTASATTDKAAGNVIAR